MRLLIPRYVRFWFFRKIYGNSFSRISFVWFFRKNVSHLHSIYWPNLSVFHYVKSVQIQSYFWSIFNPNMGKHGPEKLHIWTLFTLCLLLKILGNIYLRGCGVLKIEINLIFLVKPFFGVTKKSRQKSKYLQKKKRF